MGCVEGFEFTPEKYKNDDQKSLKNYFSNLTLPCVTFFCYLKLHAKVSSSLLFNKNFFKLLDLSSNFGCSHTITWRPHSDKLHK